MEGEGVREGGEELCRERPPSRCNLRRRICRDSSKGGTEREKQRRHKIKQYCTDAQTLATPKVMEECVI